MGDVPHGWMGESVVRIAKPYFVDGWWLLVDDLIFFFWGGGEWSARSRKWTQDERRKTWGGEVEVGGGWCLRLTKADLCWRLGRRCDFGRAGGLSA